jgi:glycosyltransferase involved in cell wall biosynthesis
MPPHHPGKPSSVYNIVAAGTLEYRKGFDLLIDVMSIIVEENHKVHLTLLGDGPEKENLRKQIHSLNLSYHVRLAGYQINPFTYFSKADLFVLSSRYEGLPNAMLESLACGTPVVAFNCPGGIDEIIVDELQGALVPENDVHALSKAIEKQMRSHKHAKGSLLPGKFDAKAVVPAYEKLALSE